MSDVPFNLILINAKMFFIFRFTHDFVQYDISCSKVKLRLHNNNNYCHASEENEPEETYAHGKCIRGIHKENTYIRKVLEGGQHGTIQEGEAEAIKVEPPQWGDSTRQHRIQEGRSGGTRRAAD